MLPPFLAGGLVGVAEFAVLPQIGSGATALWTLAAMAPCLRRLWWVDGWVGVRAIWRTIGLASAQGGVCW